MQTRRLGQQGLQVSALGLGCMGMSAGYGDSDVAGSTATIHRALDLGVTLLDTADAYGPGTNEQLVGHAVAGRRDEVIIATKFGNHIDDNGVRTGRITGRPAYIRAAADRSLLRLGLDVIDLYYQHRVATDTPLEETYGALADLVSAGKIRYVGISEAAPETIRRAHGICPLSVVQTEYSLFSRDVEKDGVLATVRELGIGFVPYSPLSRGLLAGRIRSLDGLASDDFRRSVPRFLGDDLRRNLTAVDELTALAAKKGTTVSRLALAWVLAQGEDMVPIPGTRSRVNLEDNLEALHVDLSDAELRAIDKAVPAGRAAGDRYSAAGMVTVNR